MPVVHQEPVDRTFFRAFDVLVLAVVCVSYTAIGLLALGAFDARLALVGGLLAATAVRWLLPAGLEAQHASTGRPIYPVILLVVLAALLFRTEPFKPLHGGQDQGVYTSMSAHLQREGSPFIDDPLPAALPDERLRDIYAKGHTAGTSDPCSARQAQPGICYAPWNGDYVFQFYHLHPLWMAVFGEWFGDAARFHALTFFSLLGLAALGLLVYEITGRRMAALAAGLLLAINPLHVYFSRIHVAELFALAFSALGFYYLVRAARGVEREAPPPATAALAALSALALGLVFFVRITGFLYLPLVLVVYGLGLWWTTAQRPSYTRQVVGYGVLVAALYGASVLYGLHYSPNYSRGIYWHPHARLFGMQLQTLVTILVLAVVAAGALWPLLLQRGGLRSRLALVAKPGLWLWLATAFVVVGVAASLREAYLIGFTERYVRVFFYEGFDIIGSGPRIFWQTGAAGWLLYTSPLLALVGIVGAHSLPRRWPVVLLYVFMASCLLANLAGNIAVVRYHYYYARYLASEIVPYGIALAVAVTFLSSSRRLRATGAAAIALAAPLFLYFTLQQMPVREGERPYAVMQRIAETVDDGVLLFDIDGYGGRPAWELFARLQTPLDHYFGLDVFPYESGDLDEIVARFGGLSGRGVWLLSNRPATHPDLRLVRTFDYWDTRMQAAATIPVSIDEKWWRQRLHFYRLPGVCETPGCALRLDDGRVYPTRLGYVYADRMLGPGWHGLEAGHVWSSASQTVVLSRSWFEGGRWPAALLLEVRGYAASPDHRVTLTARSGEVRQQIVFDSGGLAVHEVGLDCPESGDTCTVQLDVDGARTPSEVSGSADSRTLGVALHGIGIRY